LSIWVVAGGPVQGPVTRADAVRAAVTQGVRAALARADTAVSGADLQAALAYQNPSLSGSYSKDTPHYHLLASVPLDLPWVRGPRVDAARATRDAARYGFASNEAQLRYEADTTYTRALAARGHARLSRRNASDADSLLRIAELRAQAGDASELDVELARVNAGDLETEASDDSLAALDALLSVQVLMGRQGDSVEIALGDSLAPPQDTGASGPSLQVLEATARLDAARADVAVARGGVFAAPVFQVGFDTDDPGIGGQRGLLPTAGFTLPFPLFNRNGAAVREAEAERAWAAADLERVRQNTSAELAQVRRSFSLAQARLARSRTLVASAERVAAMSLDAYREGAVPLANVLDAELRSRDTLARFIDDLAATNNGAAAVRRLASGAGP
jgi:outer membrane protein, heavy metal efflux system